MTGGETFEEAVGPWLRELRQYCFYLTGSAWDGEDLFQEAVSLTFRYYQRRGAIKEIRPFLMKVARNKAIDVHRRRRIREAPEDAAREEGRRDICYFEIRGWMEWVAARLPANQLTVWLLADYFGYTMNEIARGLELTMSAVRSLLFRAREKLRACRNGSGPEPEVDAAGIRRSRKSQPTPDKGERPAVEVYVAAIAEEAPLKLLRIARTGS